MESSGPREHCNRALQQGPAHSTCGPAQALGHACRLGSGSDSPSTARAPTSSFFTGALGEGEGISFRDRGGVKRRGRRGWACLSCSWPLPPHLAETHLVQVMATNEALGIQIEGGIGIVGPGEGSEKLAQSLSVSRRSSQCLCLRGSRRVPARVTLRATRTGSSPCSLNICRRFHSDTLGTRGLKACIPCQKQKLAVS